jgi:hypothetical protein
MRAISLVVDVSINTVTRLPHDLSPALAGLLLAEMSQ